MLIARLAGSQTIRPLLDVCIPRGLVAVSTALLIFASSLAHGDGARLTPPASRTSIVRDVYHGVSVEDPYRWLEDATDPEVRAWSAAQAAYARAYLDSLPDASSIRTRLTALLTRSRGTTYDAPSFSGGRLFVLRSRPDAERPSLVWFEHTNTPEDAHVVVDLAQFDPTGRTSIDWYRPSPDGKLVAASLSNSGSERGALHIFDADTGELVENESIPNVHNATAGGDLAWSPDSQGFFYTRYPRPGERDEAELAFYQQVYFHELDTPIAKDRYELGAELPRVAAIRLISDQRTGRVLAWVQNGDSGQFRFFLRDVGGSWRSFGRFGDGHFEAAFGNNGDIFVLTTAGAPRGRVLRISARDLDLKKADVVIPESEGALTHSFYRRYSPTIALSGDALFLVYQKGGPTELRVYSQAGAARPAPTHPALVDMSALTSLGNGRVLFAVESFVAPRRWIVYDSGAAHSAEALTDPQAVAWDDVEAIRDFAVSQDGTRVPVTVLRMRGVKTRGLLLTGYGGYRISMTPQFTRELRLLLEQGVAYAVANLRGGSEFGEEWHRLGSLTHKQNVFDDFIAVAEHLHTEGFVPEDKLAITGSSNGGLLVGAVMTQQPSLARAVVAHVGIYDSLRNELDANGAFNIPELGTVADAAQFRAMYAYSPYHNVREGQRYPATLFFAGANDNRVNPMHSRKMTARLQAANASAAPVLLRMSANTGHGRGTPLSSRIEELTDAYTFILDALGIKYRVRVAEDEATPTVTVTARRVANDEPASLYATIATALRYDPEVDLQSRGLAEAQSDVTVRGGVFENTAIAVGAVTVHDPQTGHYSTLLPIDADVLSGPSVKTDTAHALLGFNATLATLAYSWRPLDEHREIAAGTGSDASRFGSVAIADTHTDEYGTVTGIEARYAASAGDGSRSFGDHEFERALLHGQRRTAASQTDLAIAWQDSFFGWPGAYTGFASLPETDHTRTALLIVNHRVDLAGDRGDSWLELGAYYRDLDDDYDFDRRTEESGTPGSFEHRTRSYAAAVQGRLAASPWAWRYGLQVSADELVRSTDLTHGHFNSRRYLKITVAPERSWELSSGRQVLLRVGATLDASSRDDEAWLPLASLSYARSYDAGADALTLSFHSSSQVPGYTALNSAPAGLFSGNADLGRERTDSLSLRYERRRHDWFARLGAFVRRDDALVDWTYLSGAPFVRQANAVDLDVVGLEALFTKEWSVADLAIGYAWLDKQADYGSAAVDASYYALNYARHRLTAAVRVVLNDRTTLFFDNELRRQASNPLRGSGTDAYLASLALEWRPQAIEGLGVSLIVDNITNSNFEEFPGTPAAQRQASLRVRYWW